MNNSNKTGVSEPFQDDLKNMIQSSRLNFLIGAGCSTPYLNVLNDIEERIRNGSGEDKEQAKADYFLQVMEPCLHILNNGENLSDKELKDYSSVIQGYRNFFEVINSLLLSRRIDILNKQVNIFTTNIDIFMEKVLEDLGLEYNDGFKGLLKPEYRAANFNRTIQQTSLHFSYISEIPNFNLIKLHGSLNWQLNNDRPLLYSRLSAIRKMKKALEESNKDEFNALYDELQILNLDHRKNDDTVFKNYHELLRLYSSYLERENSLLFVLGFSMQDRHIRDITMRVANTNPTMQIVIFCHKAEQRCKYKSLLGVARHKNLKLLTLSENQEYNIMTITELLAGLLSKNDNKGIKNE